MRYNSMMTLRCGLRIAIALAAFGWAGAMPATAARVKVVKSLCEGSPCARDFSNAALTMDLSGQIFGVDDLDGDNRSGSIFRLRLDTVSQLWTYERLYSFCAQANCADGAVPRGKLVVDVDGNLYGTASSGGPTGHGEIFRLSPDGHLGVLYGFCPGNDSCPNGTTPNIGLTYKNASSGALYDGAGWLVGATGAGGSFNGGTAFELAPRTGGWKFKHIKDYQPICTPSAMVMDSKGDVYETLRSGCGPGSISVLRQAGGAWTETPIHLFCQKSNCDDGGDPQGPVLIDQGRIFGTTQFGGTQHMGTLFELDFDGTQWNHRIVHSFCTVQVGKQFCRDGAWPLGGVIADASGNLFGTANGFGSNKGDGTIFEIDAQGGAQVLHVFCGGHSKCPEGSRPIAGLVMDSAGNLLGKTTLDGSQGSGTIFELKR